MTHTLPNEANTETLAIQLAAAQDRIAVLESQLATRQNVPTTDSLWERVVAHAPIVLWATDQNEVFTLSEGRGLTALGLKPGEAVGSTITDLYRDFPEAIDSVRQGLKGREVSLEVGVGDAIFESWIVPLRDAQGAVNGVMGVATDITARVRAEQLERQIRDRFQRVFESSPCGVVLTDLKTGRFVEANPAACRILERPLNEVIGKTAVEVGFWTNSQEHQQHLTPLESNGRARARAHRFVTPNGNIRYVNCQWEVIEVDGHQRLLTIVDDVTESIRSSHALARSRRLLRQLTRWAKAGIFRSTTAGRVTAANRQLLRAWGVDRVQLTADCWWSFLHVEDQPRVVAAWNREAPLVEEVRLAADPTRWFFLQADAPTGTKSRVVTATEITQQKMVEQQLQSITNALEERVRERTELLMRANKILEEQIAERHLATDLLESSEERWRSLVAHAPDLILVVDADGMILFINHTRVRPELAVSDVIGHTVYEFIYPEDWDRFRADLRRVFDEGVPVSNEVSGPDAHGARLWYQSHIAPMLHDGQVISATIVCRDATAQHAAADELKQKQDLLAHVARVSTVGEMTAGIAHELNQPLAAIAQFVRGCIIRLEAGGPASPEVLEILQEAVNEAHRAGEVVRRLRGFLQRGELQRTPVCAAELLRDACRLSEPALRRRGMVFHQELKSQSLCLDVDRIQIIQVLLNLILNAAEATPPEHPDRLITVRCQDGGQGFVVIQVEDSGTGLPSQLGDQIFDAFVTTKPQGLGLGLSISRSIVISHGGRLEASSLPQGGTRMSVWLPGCCLSSPDG